MSVPVLFLGELGGNRLLQADDGYQDGGNDIAIRAESVPWAPAGAGGEAIFTALFLAFTSTMAVTITVTPIVWVIDGEDVTVTELASQDIVLAANAARVTSKHELGLSVPLMNGLVEVARFAPRGTWFAVRLEAAALAVGDLILDGASVEYEVVRESMQAQAPA